MRALISVSDKNGVVDFAKSLIELGCEILSTGGTAATLASAGVPVTEVSDVTGFPECLDGRLKTLHPKIHGGILAVRGNADHMAQIELLGITPIDLLVVNLYPFRKAISDPDVSLEHAVENIDIGGPTMLRAAAKNWQDVAVIVDPSDYGPALDELKSGGITRERKFMLATKVFEHTASYDALIAGFFRQRVGGIPDALTVTFDKAQDMRYGENPHQWAAFYHDPIPSPGSIAMAEQLHGKELSFNNISDAAAALNLLKEFAEPCAVAVKHANPCGVGIGQSIFDAYMSAYDSDPVSIFGGIVALNRQVDAQTAAELAKIFLEIIIAPGFDADALEILTAKKNIRLLRLPDIAEPLPPTAADLKRVEGGMLVQSCDTELFGDTEIRTVTEREPTQIELEAMQFAWRVVKHVKSNAIVLSSAHATIGIGPGQTNRITALELAIKYAGAQALGAVMASDAFFPFPDCVEAAAAAGITAIIQPGGSVNDQQSIDAANKYGIAMLMTGMRHFKH